MARSQILRDRVALPPWGGSPARFGSSADKAHMEEQIALADAVLFGAGTIRAYSTTNTNSIAAKTAATSKTDG